MCFKEQWTFGNSSDLHWQHQIRKSVQWLLLHKSDWIAHAHTKRILYSFWSTIFLSKCAWFLTFSVPPQVWPPWVARVTTMSHLLTVLSSSVSLDSSFLTSNYQWSRWTSTSTHWSTREACATCCFEVILQTRGEDPLQTSSRWQEKNQTYQLIKS